ncbi:MAG: hypothetical protein Q4C82_06080 [Eubacteriales bacterium]|nr:hypothetical protein [Eubacteriales bacterium]
MIINAVTQMFRGVQGSYAFQLLGKAFLRLRTAIMNPFQRVVRRIQQLFNINIISSRLVGPINAKVRKILSGEAKSPDDYFTVGRFWISKMLVCVIILASCAAVFIYFNWFAAPISDRTATENLITTVYYDYDDMDLGEYTGRANIRAANGAVVYTGDIVAGVCTGNGTLWNQDGLLIYEGAFENNDFSGIGTLYYSGGTVQYKGEFSANSFSGNGVLYYPDGTKEYEGQFENGAYNGEGALYSEQGILIYEGEFQSGAYHGQGISYYSSGIKKYEGEFYMGRAQGSGKLYSSSGKELFEGAFARDDIQYEALLGMNLEEAMAMFRETPVTYYNDGGTSLLFERAQVILRVDCLVELRLDSQSSGSGSSWYIPNEDGDTLTETEESQTTLEEESGGSAGGTTEESDPEEEKDEQQRVLESLPVSNRYYIYYYLSSDEWQTQEELDRSAVNITGVSSYRDALSVGFLEGQDMTPENGAPSLQECVAIERVRLSKPTAFSGISYELTTRNRSYVEVSGINLADAIYEEVYEIDNVRYRLCYQMDEPEELLFVTVENY